MSTAKERIRLRTSTLNDGRQSLYLDYVKDGERVRKRLHLYLLPETSNKNRMTNKRTKKEAEAKRAERLEEITLYDADIYIPSKVCTEKRITLADMIDKYTKEMPAEKWEKSKAKISCLRRAVDAFRGLSVNISDVNEEYCDKFVDFLHKDYVGVSGKIKMTTARTIIYMFSSVLNQAVQDGTIRWNPIKGITVHDRITRERPKRVFLTVDEIRKLLDEPCPVISRPQVKQAFLFSVFTGLTKDDLIKLKWKDITAENGKQFVAEHSQSNKVPLCPMAIKWLPVTSNHRGLVFKGLPKETEISNILRLWQKKAGIEKALTFPVSRNTFAYLLLSAGSDIITTSSLLGVKPKFLRPYLQMVEYVPPTQDERFYFLFQGSI